MPAMLEQVTSRTYRAPFPTFSYTWQVVCRECSVGLNSGHQYNAANLHHAINLADEHNHDHHHNTQHRLAGAGSRS